jgi:hypothetical protein
MPAFTTKERYDYLFSFEAGMDSGQAPSYLESNQLAYALNLTVRSAFAHPRPAFVKKALTFASDAIKTAFQTGLFQGGCYYKPDSGIEVLIASISGRLYRIDQSTGVVLDITGATPQSATATQCWLWQAENYVIWNDGTSLPVFYDGTVTVRSNGFPAALPNTTFSVLNNFDIPSGYDGTKAVPDTKTFTLTTPFIGAPNDHVVLGLGSVTPVYGQVTVIAGPIVTVRFDLKLVPTGNLGLVTAGGGTGFYNSNVFKVAAGTNFINLEPGATPPLIPQLPAGRMGAYGQGRNVMSLPDGKQFIYSDIVGGASGTKALQFRDAVLNTTENAFLVGGGTFTIPGSVGDIRAMVFPAVLDVSLGQGPLQIHTPTHVFSCAVPVDRLTWQNLQNPILTPPLIGAGGLGQNSTILCNGDVFFRSLVGIQTVILARRDFQTWGNVPISREMQRVMKDDDQNLLPYSSAINFDNRMLMTIKPTSTTQGVYHQGLVALNFDPISTIRGKLPSVYDGAWTGLNSLQLITGEFQLVNKAFAFNLNTVLGQIELYEILPSANETVLHDNGTNPIPWFFESSTLFNYDDKSPTERVYKRLLNGEIYVDDLQGTVNFQVFFKPDSWPCWVPWISWTECATMTADNAKPQFRPRMGLGEPSAFPCDESTNRPLREGFSFQVKCVVTGHCTFMGGRFVIAEIPQPLFPAPDCA